MRILKNTFGKSLRKIRKHLGLNQADFAIPLGITGSYISDIERGGVEKPSEPVIQSIANHYQVNREYLETGTGKMFLPDTSQVAEGSDHPDTPAIDIETLAAVIKGVEDYLKDGKKELDPETKARLVSLIYERFAKTGEEPNQETIVSYLKLVA